MHSISGSPGTSQKRVSYILVPRIDDGLYRRMFFVFHTRQVNSGEVETDDERVTVIGPDKLAELVADAGLVGWLIRKVS